MGTRILGVTQFVPGLAARLVHVPAMTGVIRLAHLVTAFALQVTSKTTTTYSINLAIVSVTVLLMSLGK